MTTDNNDNNNHYYNNNNSDKQKSWNTWKHFHCKLAMVMNKPDEHIQ